MGGQHSTSQTARPSPASHRRPSPSPQRWHKPLKNLPEMNNNTTTRSTTQESISLIDKEARCEPANVTDYYITHSANQDVSFSKEVTRLQLETANGRASSLIVEAKEETVYRFHLKVSDSSTAQLTHRDSNFKKAHHPQYTIEYREDPFSLVVKRKTTGFILFDSSHGELRYEEGRMRVTTAVYSRCLYGLTSARTSFLIDTRCGGSQPFSCPTKLQQTQNCQPFFLALEEDGNAHGLYLCNNFITDISIRHGQPGYLSYDCGRAFDLYIFTGPGPMEVVQQYQEMIGRPHIPPYWSLGFHFAVEDCHSAVELNSAIEKRKQFLTPHESQWADLDINLPQEMLEQLGRVVQNLHGNGQRYIPIISQNVLHHRFVQSPTSDNKAVTQGKERPVIGSPTEELRYWLEFVQRLHRDIPFDGLCLDVDESDAQMGCDYPSCDLAHAHSSNNHTRNGRNGMAAVRVSRKRNHSTVERLSCASLRDANSLCRRVRGRRSLLISSYTTGGSGQYSGHCIGKVLSFPDLRHSIAAILANSMYGVSLVGSDISSTCTGELYIRWLQLAAFFPLLKNTSIAASKTKADLETDEQAIVNDIVRIRYSLLPFLYTLLYECHMVGTTAVRPLLMIYPKDKQTYSIDSQFMWGSSLLFSPCLTRGASTVSAYFPFDIWYDFFSGYRLDKVGATVQLPSPLSHTNIHVRGGSIISTQSPGQNTSCSQRSPFGLLAALDCNHSAKGRLYWDDGESLDPAESKSYNLIRFNIEKGCLTSQLEVLGYRNCNMQLKLVQIFGLFVPPETVIVNGSATPFTYRANRVLQLDRLNVNLLEPLQITW
ncbi:lysosomal alpha-glucosidase-like [Watersipora subatra]|uniref:lysosomal alpha-glucosidase-like n=1 Tax=Watersipora subatra TaxID=2589382 RepID=UPI00355B9C93